jgi:hypothetical protein
MPDDDQPEGVVTLRLEGADEHRGHIMAHALAQKLTQFLNVFAAFERARVKSGVRQTDFEIVVLSHNSPSELGLHPVPRVMNYLPTATVRWTFNQWEKIANGERPSDEIGEDLILEVAALARRQGQLDYTNFSIRFGPQRIIFDDSRAKCRSVAHGHAAERISSLARGDVSRVC